MAYPTADQVKDAYALNLQPAAAAVSQFGETLANNQRLARQRKKEEQAQQIQGLAQINDAIDPLSKGTGYSPYDDLNTAHIGEIKNQATKMVMAGADPASTYMYLQNATNGLKARQGDAMKGITAAEAYAKAQAASNSSLDYMGMRQQYLDNIFYNKDEKGNKSFNTNFNPAIDFTQGVQPVYDMVKLKQNAALEVPKLFPERDTPSVPSPDNPLITLSAKAPAYHTVDPATQKTVWNVKPITIKGADGQTANVPVIADDGIVDALYNAPNSGALLRMQEKDMRRLLPSTVRDEDIRRIVATDYLQQTGHQPGAGVTEDAGAYNRARQERQDALANAHWSASFTEQQKSGKRAQERFDWTKKNATTGYVDPFKVQDAWINNKIQPGTPEAALVAANTFNYAGHSVTDMTNIAEKPTVKDPETGGQVKILGFTDPNTMQKKYLLQYYRKSTPSEVANGDPELKREEDANGNPKVKTLSGADLKRFHLGVAPQMQLDTKKKNYNAVIGSQSLAE